MLRGRRDSYHRRGLALGLATAAIMAPLQLGAGDLLGRTVAHNQPAKLAAIEGQYPTERGAGLSLGSFPVPGHDHAVLNIKVPKLLSVLALDDAHAKVRGLSSFPKSDRTPLALPVRLSFLGMVGIGTFLVALSLWYWLRRRGRPRPEDRWTLLAVAGSGPLAFLANELGWLVSEFGRQPWVIYGVLRTRDAVTTAPGLDVTFTGFVLLYVALAAATIWGLRRLASGAPAGLSSYPRRGLTMAVALIAVGVGWISVYAMFGGADFGAGILHLLSAGLAPHGRGGDRDAMGPVWEANHVWLIFAITGLFSAFPRAFSTLGTLVFAPGDAGRDRDRGAGRGVRIRGPGAEGGPSARLCSNGCLCHQPGGPVPLGIVAGGMARARPGASWLLDRAVRAGVGAMAVAICAALAAAFLTVESGAPARSGWRRAFAAWGIRAAAAAARWHWRASGRSIGSSSLFGGSPVVHFQRSCSPGRADGRPPGAPSPLVLGRPGALGPRRGRRHLGLGIRAVPASRRSRHDDRQRRGDWPGATAVTLRSPRGSCC